MNKKPTLKNLKLVETWNKKYPVGTDVIVHRDNETNEHTRTRSIAQLLGNHTPVIWLEGIVSCYALDKVYPIHIHSTRPIK